MYLNVQTLVRSDKGTQYLKLIESGIDVLAKERNVQVYPGLAFKRLSDAIKGGEMFRNTAPYYRQRFHGNSNSKEKAIL